MKSVKSNFDTLSEKLFAQYCETRGYAFEKIPTTGTRTPDFTVTTPFGEMIVEVKEIEMNHDDHALMKAGELGVSFFKREAIGSRVRAQLRSGSGQLHPYDNDPRPTALVVFDKVAFQPEWPFELNDHLSELDIDAAMFGQPIVRFFWKNKPRGPNQSEWNHGGNRRCTESRGLSFSCVIALDVASYSGAGLRTRIYHNPFARKPLIPSYLSHPDDEHFIKDGHPDLCGQVWHRYSGPR